MGYLVKGRTQRRGQGALEDRRREALARNEAWSKLSFEERIVSLKTRPGKSAKQIAKLEKLQLASLVPPAKNALQAALHTAAETSEALAGTIDAARKLKAKERRAKDSKRNKRPGKELVTA